MRNIFIIKKEFLYIGMSNMVLRQNTDMICFLQTVEKCSGEVSFTTTQGDRLNLKSELSKYVFAVVAANPDILKNGQIVIKNEEDAALLQNFLMGE